MLTLNTVAATILVSTIAAPAAPRGSEPGDSQAHFRDAVYATVHLSACEHSTSEFLRLKHTRADGIKNAAIVVDRSVDDVIIEATSSANELMDFYDAYNETDILCLTPRSASIYEGVSLTSEPSRYFERKKTMVEEAVKDIKIHAAIVNNCKASPEARQVASGQLKILRRDVFEATRLNYKESLYPRAENDC